MQFVRRFKTVPLVDNFIQKFVKKACNNKTQLINKRLTSSIIEVLE